MEVFHHNHAGPSPVVTQSHEVPSHVARGDSLEDEPAIKKRKSEVESALKSGNVNTEGVRNWSTQVENAIKHNEEQMYTYYQLVAFYGDPEKPLPGFIKYAKKEVIREMLLDVGFQASECTGYKRDLLQKLQRDKPFVQFKIDGREGFQRILATALHSWKYDLSHVYSAKMPLRGIDPTGAKTFKEIFSDFYENGLSSYDPDFRKLIMMDIAANEFPDYSRVEREQLVLRVLSGKVDGEAHRPTRVVKGVAFELPGELTKRNTRVNDTIHEKDLSIEHASLHAGDRIKYIYDFGDPHTIVVYVEKVLHDHIVVPEMKVGYLPVRAEIMKVSDHKPPPQYPAHSEESQGTEENEDETGQIGEAQASSV